MRPQNVEVSTVCWTLKDSLKGSAIGGISSEFHPVPGNPNFIAIFSDIFAELNAQSIVSGEPLTPSVSTHFVISQNAARLIDLSPVNPVSEFNIIERR